GHANSMEGEIVRTLNELYLGQPWHPVSHPQSITAGQQQALDKARDAVRRFGAPPEGLIGSGALEELRVLSDHAGENATVAPLDFDNINSLSLPDGGFKPVPLDTLGGDAGRRIVERFHDMMLPQSGCRARIESEGPRKLYTDPALRNPKLHVPDKVALASRATFAGLHVDGGKPIAVAEVDLADAFYTMLLPPKFRRYFALPGCRAGMLGLESTMDGRRLVGTDLAHPCFRRPPMGCSFSLWICQTMLEGMALQVPQLPLANRFVDRRPVPQVSEGVIHTEYVDTAISLSTNLETAAAAASAVDSNLRAAGPPTQGVECSLGAVALGWQFDEKFPIIGLNPALRWKLRLAFLELCQRGRTARLWPSCLREFRWCASLGAFCFRDAGAAFDSTLTMVDSSRWGVGVTQKKSSASVALELSKYNERWRFSTHQESEVSHRPHAFKSATSANPSTPESIITIDCSGNPKAPIKEPLEVPVEEPVKESAVKGVHAEEEMFNDIEEEEEFPEIPYDVRARGTCRAWAMLRRRQIPAASAPPLAAPALGAGTEGLLARAGPTSGPRPASKRRRAGPPTGRASATAAASSAGPWELAAEPLDRPGRASRRRARHPQGVSWRGRNQRSFLALKAVGDRTALDYQVRYQAFLTWLANAGLSVATVTDLEEALLQYFNQQYFDGHDSPDGPKLVAAVAHFRLDLAPKLANLPRVLRALKGWKTLAPPRARLPLPWPVVALVADWMVANGFLAAARATVLTFALYLRPSETLSSRVKSVARPVRASPRHLSKYSILLLPAELEARSKTKDSDISILLDNPEPSWVDQMLDRLVEGRAVDAPLFPLDMRSWARAFQQAGAALGLGALGPPVLHQLRHGGASHEMLPNAREFGDIKKRGRWEADRSLKRHAKGPRLRRDYWKHPMQNLSSWAHLSDSKVYLEIFSGSGNWPRALRRSMASRLAQRVFELDVDHEPIFGDLSRRRAQGAVRGWLRGGLLQGVWLGMPCSSWSRARNRPNGPPALRDATHVLGLPNLSSGDSLKVETGNRLSQFTFSLFLERARRGVPAAIENPSTSR
ncbi:unnamed protein product, partial [Prorocentrum cordatum]